MPDINLVIDTLIADDPRRGADRMLSRLCAIASAQGGALLQATEDNPTVVLSHQLPLTSVASLSVRWADHRAALSAGRAVVEKTFALLPVVNEGTMVAAIYLADPSGVGADRLRAMVDSGAAVFAAAASAAPNRTGQPAAMKSGDVKTQMVRILESNDWNIAKVSRILGVTRRTLYMRMASFGIKRKKVPRLIKPLTV